MKPLFERMDANQDGALDASELATMRGQRTAGPNGG